MDEFPTFTQITDECKFKVFEGTGSYGDASPDGSGCGAHWGTDEKVGTK